jgi:hypothetical protein
MARTESHLFPIAVSPNRLSECVGVRRQEVYDAIADEVLPAYRRGQRRFVLVEDAVRWVRTFDRLKLTNKRSKRHGR